MGWNVFSDLDLPRPDELFLKTSLMLAIAEIMRKSGLTQVEIAERTGLKQPEVSRILSERAVGFSTDRLARIAFKLGYLPTIDLKPMSELRRPRAKAPRKTSRTAA